MKTSNKILLAAAVAGLTLLVSTSAGAFFGPFSWMRSGGWGGWDDWYGYPYYGYYNPWGYGHPYGWGGPYYGYGAPFYGYGYPYPAVPTVAPPQSPSK